jgi:hypothetical protein
MRWGLPFAFLKDIPREIFSIKFVKPAPRGNHSCTRTSPLKNVQVRAISQELLWRTLPWSVWRFFVCRVRAVHLR